MGFVDKEVNKEYQEVIDACKVLKSHATNALLLDDGLIALQPIVEGICNYMILHNPNPYPRFRRLYINLAQISPINSKFKKTLSYIQWKAKDGLPYIEITNPNTDPYIAYILNAQVMTESVLNDAYSKIPGWNEVRQRVLIDEPDDLYTRCEGLAADLASKKMCRVVANGNQLMFSKPFLGDTKNTDIIMYRIVQEDPGQSGKITVKFKQKEKIGNIYTYASFLKIKEEVDDD